MIDPEKRPTRSRTVDPCCGRCGYDVRKLPSHICPECGSDLRRVGLELPDRRRYFTDTDLVAFIAIVAFALLLTCPAVALANAFSSLLGLSEPFGSNMACPLAGGILIFGMGIYLAGQAAMNREERRKRWKRFEKQRHTAGQ
jgi:hypothetical protein